MHSQHSRHDIGLLHWTDDEPRSASQLHIAPVSSLTELNPQFLAEWQTPVPLDVIFDSPNVNWSYSSFTAADHPVLGQSDLVSASADLDSELVSSSCKLCAIR